MPVYNESAHIAAPLREMAEFLRQHAFTAGLVLVDGGSSDDTAAVVGNVAGALDVPIRLIRYA